MDDVVVAAPDTLLGQLQRGRGAGFLAALGAPREEALDALRECVGHDPRWNHQLECRAESDADLGVAIGLDVGWLAPTAAGAAP